MLKSNTSLIETTCLLFTSEYFDKLMHERQGFEVSNAQTWRPIPASRLWPKKVENFTFEWLQLLVQTCYQQVFDW